VLRFVSDTFETNHRSTIGVAFQSRSIDIGGEIIQFHIWDTAGQEKYKALTPIYYRRASAAIVVYDITSENSFQCMKTWVNELKQAGPEDIVLAVAGNKCDLEEKRQVSYDEGILYANQIDAIFFETSAKTGENVDDLFFEIGRDLQPRLVAQPMQMLNVGNRQETNERSGSCCK